MAEIIEGEFKEDTLPKKTAMQELKDKIAVFQKLSLAWTIISLLFSTAFLIYSVFAKFGNPIYRYVSLGALGIYVLIFLSLFIFAVEGKKKNQKNKKQERSRKRKNACCLKRTKRAFPFLKPYST